MRPSEIEVGKTYINVRTGRTRTVSRIRTDWGGNVFVHYLLPPPRYYLLPPPRFGTFFCLLKSFARWAGKELK
jgi:hypothetical protein